MEFAEVGDHCHMKHCNRQDFLPFKCDCCHITYCLEHRSYTSHSCPQAGNKSMIAIVCPLCKYSININENSDANMAWEEHNRSGKCDPMNPKKRKPKCAADGCKAKLGPSSKFTCDHCRLEVCLNHRFPDKHNCQGKRATMKRASENRRSNNNTFTSMFSSSSSSSNNNTRKNSNNNNNNNNKKNIKSFDSKKMLMETADRRRQDRENCPHCSMTFSTPIDLISHVETNHLKGNKGTTPSPSSRIPPPPPSYIDLTHSPPGYTIADDIGRPPNYHNITTTTTNNNNNSSSHNTGNNGGCPFCGASFSDPVELVNHVESFHQGDSINNTAATTTTDGKKDCCVS